jgi:hypothetical protein
LSVAASAAKQSRIDLSREGAKKAKRREGSQLIFAASIFFAPSREILDCRGTCGASQSRFA